MEIILGVKNVDRVGRNSNLKAGTEEPGALGLSLTPIVIRLLSQSLSLCYYLICQAQIIVFTPSKLSGLTGEEKQIDFLKYRRNTLEELTELIFTIHFSLG